MLGNLFGGNAWRERRGHHLHSVDDSVQYIGSQGETRGKKTQAVAGLNSLTSSRWNPWILCNATKRIQEDNRTAGRSVWQVPSLISPS